MQKLTTLLLTMGMITAVTIYIAQVRENDREIRRTMLCMDSLGGPHRHSNPEWTGSDERALYEKCR